MLNIPADSILSGKIDFDSKGISGYSKGGAGAICAVTNYENGALYKTIFTGSAATGSLTAGLHRHISILANSLGSSVGAYLCDPAFCFSSKGKTSGCLAHINLFIQ